MAARMSGLSRLADGIFHGLVAWGVSTLVFAYILTTSIGSVIGGAFSVLGAGAKTVAGGAAVTAGGVAGSQNAQNQIETLLKGSSGGQINQDAISNLQSQLSAGNRDGAVFVLTQQMGFAPDRAEQIVNTGTQLFGSAQNLPQQARNAASSAISGLSKTSWVLFVGVLLSMALGVFGGAVGSKATVRRRSPLSHGVHA